MSHRHDDGLDPRAWIAWALAASVPPLVGRNPWPLAMVLIAVAGVRLTWADAMTSRGGWSFFVRIALIFAAIGVIFNVLTVRAGDHVIARVPGELPFAGSELTLNAAIYGVLSGFALVLLVMIGATTGALIDWPAVIRLMPDRLTSIAVAGSIAFAFVPQTTGAYREIREAQLARGHRFRGARDLLPIVVPVLGSGLERALTLAESLESRGFGGVERAGSRPPRGWPPYLGAGALGLLMVAVYAIVAGQARLGLAGAVVGLILGALYLATAERQLVARTRYRTRHWQAADTAVALGAALGLLAEIGSLQVAPVALRYEPYPHAVSPAIGLPLLAGLLGLLMPLLVAPPPKRGGQP